MGSSTPTQGKDAVSDESFGTGYGMSISAAGLDDISIDDEEALHEFGGLKKSQKWTASSSSSLSEYGKVFDLDLLKKKMPLHDNSYVISGKSDQSKSSKD